MNKSVKAFEDELISVIMSVYNNEAEIVTSIESILNQSYKNFELLVIDDCSTDDTLKKLKSVNDKRIKIFENKENIGLTKSLNKLIKEARGKIIARQDGDDISEPDRLEKQIRCLVGNGLDVCTTRAFRKNSKKKIPNFSFHLPYRIVMKLKNPFIHGTLMIKKNVLINVGMYDEDFLYAQDYKLFSDLLKENYKIMTISTPLYHLNMTDNISTNKKSEQKYYADCVRFRKTP